MPLEQIALEQIALDNNDDANINQQHAELTIQMQIINVLQENPRRVCGDYKIKVINQVLKLKH